jgi:hypothetical protein
MSIQPDPVIDLAVEVIGVAITKLVFKNMKFGLKKIMS